MAGAATSKDGMKWMRHQMGIHQSISIEEFLNDVVLGKNEYVEMSEKFLSEIEDQIPVSRGWRMLDDVVGGVPNVPAYLAGHPQHMRRRVRAARDNAPLTIFMNLTSSMGIPAHLILKRGVVLMSLVRMLVEHRPVELWVGTSLDDMATAAWRIDTTPLDLARAAYHVADVNMSRLFGYAMCETLTDCHLGGGSFVMGPDVQGPLREVAGWHEVMWIPRIHLYDEMTTDPVAWLRRVMKQYVPSDE